MAKIFLVLNSEGAEVKEILSSSNYELKEYNPSEEITNQVNNFRPDIVLIQSSIENLESSLRQLKPLAKTHNLQTLLLIDGDVEVFHTMVGKCQHGVFVAAVESA